ncbi:photosystem II reaction center protein PsbZ [Coleofasciculus sp. FACHB-64]|uniref:photosystem II reaction center protein PsbZ n=1 Tax=Cyanophyceae TaxID=3028117 RepID=UPI00168831EB|nr:MULTISPECIES: photosystem II reaction center protein PsbZ [unclassified Coleofasciculus]MBD1839435.1 photosystem II reaction center protein PsbZ [Coleofasciculus sp. FACHB-501]MBD1879252.1 photosystem II reaction center protein PsbZ [Coleofasciculus sp. FACHB-T130]MBD1892042.1 photosystem II reaction center protein PsbZ [Coleofasciculus sp. FACHB-SPT9]MBD1895981.1 photosystem II reaction center protein PsbZ [Coleofasciculus sp. FACHB-129]MBD1902195.1 photosystem II reaction center protein P
MTILFQLVLGALVFLSFVMVIGVPVAYATPQNWDQSKRLLLLGSGVWIALVFLTGALSYLVV